MPTLLKLTLIALVVGWYQLPVLHERSQALAWAGAEQPVQTALESLKGTVGGVPMAWRDAVESAKIAAQAQTLAALSPKTPPSALPASSTDSSPRSLAAGPVKAVTSGGDLLAVAAKPSEVKPLSAPAGRAAATVPSAATVGSEGVAKAPVNAVSASSGQVDASTALSTAKGGTVLLVGDSVMGEIAYGMKRWSAKNKSWTVVDAHKVSSGLSNLDYYDWPAVFEELMTQHKPAAVAMMVGSNDAQDIFANRKRHPFGTDSWTALYGDRAQAILRSAEKHGVRVYWAIPPVMKSSAFEKRMATVRATLKGALAAHPQSGVVLDEWKHFAGDHDEYLETGLVGGKTRSLRTDDGIHLSVAGAQVFVDALIDALTAAPVVPAPQPLAGPASSTPAAAGPSVENSPP